MFRVTLPCPLPIRGQGGLDLSTQAGQFSAVDRHSGTLTEGTRRPKEGTSLLWAWMGQVPEGNHRSEPGLPTRRFRDCRYGTVPNR